MYPATRDDMTKTDEIEPVFRDGIPWCYREKSPLYHWDGIDVEFEHLYPSGLLIKANKPCTSYSEVPMKKLRALAEQNSPVVLRNFIGADSEDVFVSKASEMGEIQSWKFGHILRVKDGGNNNGGLNNVLSREPMPFHYDGLFKIVNGVSSPPRFQMFVAFTSTPKTLGRTLFSSSRLFISHLQTNHDISESTLRELTWSVRTASFDAAKWENLPLIIDHPSTGKPALRYHENWPKEKTQFDGSIVRFDDVDADEDERLRAAIDTALYDRRVCIRVAWEKGDVIVSDNVSMMHTREGFDSNEKRELWRVHVD